LTERQFLLPDVRPDQRLYSENSLLGQKSTHARTVTASARKAPIQMTTKQPPPVSILPIFRSLPLLVIGMPIDLDNRDLAAEMPVNRFHEKPPLFI
jgi:hypothetical protein